jgi:diguanylate cyclase (GGDEF)-like protein
LNLYAGDQRADTALMEIDQPPEFAISRVLAGLNADPHSAQFVVDRNMVILWASEGNRSLIGYDPSEMVGRPAIEFLYPDDLPLVLEVVRLSTEDPTGATRRQQGSGVRQTVDVRVRAHDGWKVLTMRGVAAFDDPHLAGMFVTLSLPDGHRVLLEAMQSVAAHAPLVASLRILLGALSRSGENETIGAFVDGEGRVVVASENCRVSNDLADLWGPLGIGRASWTVDVPVVSVVDDDIESGSPSWTLHVLSAIATRHPVDVFMASKVASLATLAIESANSRRRQFEMARVDELTGVGNRRAFLESLSGRENDLMTMVIIDLDRFKAVNDRFGHHVGDAALVEVARVLTESVHPGDVVARLGGDEFTVVLRGPIDDRSDTVEALRTVLARVPVPVADCSVCVSASVGVAQHTEGDPLKTLRRADQLLLQSKAEGVRPAQRGRREFRDA